MNDLPLILASSSPRRRQLLAEWGYKFTVVPPGDAAEQAPGGTPGTPSQLVSQLAYQKAQDVALRVDRGIIIACDTVAECHGQILGKPRDPQHARQMLELLRGQEHRVYSGLCVWRKPDNAHRVEVEITTLIMDAISDAELASYLASDQWEGKAGAFGYQDGLDWIRVLSGSESNVVGLPMELLTRMLADLDYRR